MDYNKLKKNLKTEQSLLAFSVKHKIEVLPTDKDCYLINLAKELAPSIEKELRALVGDTAQIEFKVAPKLRTELCVNKILHHTHPETAKVIPDIEHRTIVIEMTGPEDNDPVWGELTEVLKQDGFFSSWKFIANGKETCVESKLIEELVKNKEQHTGMIDDNAITDLKIGLANANTVDDILNMMGR